MKKVFIALIIVFMLSACGTPPKKTQTAKEGGIWLTYYELDKMMNSSGGFREEFKKVIENCNKLCIKNLYVHTRAFGQTIYKSDYFTLLKSARKCDFDVLEYIINQCKKADIKVYAWINPYRISSNTDIESVDSESPVYKWLKDEDRQNDRNVGFANGIYLNPSSSEARKTVLQSIRELTENYDIDGIHFDDYFYPTTKSDFDKYSYSEYKLNCENALSLSDWRRENVNLLISSCRNILEYSGKNIIFSISPAASIENNYKNLYADVELWIKNGLVDEIIPQLYFGFMYPDKNFRFDNLLKRWEEAASLNQNVTLKIGLGDYKAIPELEPDMDEWQNNSDIIARQVKICDLDSKVSGYVYFSYSTLTSNKKAYKAQRENLLEYLKTVN